MKRIVVLVLVILSGAAGTAASQAAPAPARSPSSPSSGNLETVLNAMDRAAAGFKSAEANFVWDQFTQVIKEHDYQKGVIYYRRSGHEVEMAADIADPAKKYVLFRGGKVDVYQPGIEQVTEYNAGKNKAEFESFLVLGFGGRGHDLAKSFEVRYDGPENVLGVQSAKLSLTPKSAKVHGMFQTIVLWIDPARGISVQQKFIEPSGDYRLAQYSNIKLNEKIPDSTFKLRTTGKTKWVRPQE